jgi:hypothetical protein
VPDDFILAVDRSALGAKPVRVLSTGRNRTKAKVSIYDVEGRLVVLKDFGECGALVRNTIGRFSIAREARAYARLSGLPGIPEFHGRVGPFALACAYVPGPSLPECERRSLPSAFFRALEELLAAVHARGVAITDLHHRNVIVSEPGGAPALIDFSLALGGPGAWNLPGRWIFAQAQQLDRFALARIRETYERPSEAAAGAGPRGALAGRQRGASDSGPGTDRVEAGARASGFPATTGSGARLGGSEANAAHPDPADSGFELDAPPAPVNPPALYAFGRAIKRVLHRLKGRS